MFPCRTVSARAAAQASRCLSLSGRGSPAGSGGVSARDSNRDLTAISAAAGIAFLTRAAILDDAYPFALSAPAQAVSTARAAADCPFDGPGRRARRTSVYRSLAKFKKLFPAAGRWRFGRVGGLLVGAIGIYYPQVMSAGYPAIIESLHGGWA